MSAKLVQQQYIASDVDRVLEERLPITINGSEKFATGLTKRTTVEDVIFAMMSVSDASFKPEHLCDYGIVEKWQGNERILDGKIKIYKLIRLWKSLPGDQLQHVQFIIKKRASKAVVKKTEKNKFAFCTMSPAMVKGWNVEKSQRKSSYVQRQLESDSESSSDVDSDLNSESSESCVDEQGNLANHKRYASIKRFNRSRNSSVKQIKKSFVELVNKQNEIIDKQLNQINETRSKSRSLKSKMGNVAINASDIKETFSGDLSEQQVKEYSSLCKNYFKLQSCLNHKLEHIDTLKSELDQMGATDNANSQLDKVNKKLQNKIEMSNIQSQKLNEVGVAINKIDDVISLKEKFIKSLELELQQLDSNEVTLNANKKSLASTSESARSSTSSTSSVFTSISSISTSQYANVAHVNKGLGKLSYGDNESDTGISSANSEEFNSHLETLV